MKYVYIITNIKTFNPYHLYYVATSKNKALKYLRQLQDAHKNSTGYLNWYIQKVAVNLEYPDHIYNPQFSSKEIEEMNEDWLTDAMSRND